MNIRNETIERYYRDNYKHLVNIATRKVHNKCPWIAEECVQEAFTKALTLWGAYNSEQGRLDQWFYRILMGVVNDSIRQEAGYSCYDNIDEYIDSVRHVDTELDAQSKDNLLLIEKDLEGKNEIQTVIDLAFRMGLRSIDVAYITGITHSNVRKIIQRFRETWQEANIFKKEASV